MDYDWDYWIYLHNKGFKDDVHYFLQEKFRVLDYQKGYFMGSIRNTYDTIFNHFLVKK